VVLHQWLVDEETAAKWIGRFDRGKTLAALLTANQELVEVFKNWKVGFW
jgi:hypothetical protein